MLWTAPDSPVIWWIWARPDIPQIVCPRAASRIALTVHCTPVPAWVMEGCLPAHRPRARRASGMRDGSEEGAV